MAEKKPKPQPDQPTGGIPSQPPMQDRTLPWWPLIAALIAFAIWLIFLAILAFHSERWRPS
ncbi:MAG: hypothetical protein PHU85_18905 [Phycisphaerae bacterium]|nr:hypothetical protein [Phycisphaerae bacterium]